MKILVVDDENFVIELTKRHFAGIDNVAAIRCFDTEDVLKAIGKEHPDTIFLDHNFGDGGVGLQIARQLLAQPNPPTIFSISSDVVHGDLYEPYAKLGIMAVEKNEVPKKIKELLGLK